MIRTIITHSCPDCGSTDLVKNGRDYKGSQKFHCKTCKRYGTLQAQKGYPETSKQTVKRALLERNSLRGLTRISGIARSTVQRWLDQWIAQAKPLETTLVPSESADILELDELWSFVLKKTAQCWLWLAICRRTRQVVAYYLGDRSAYSAFKLWQALPSDYRRCASFSDYWSAYRYVFDCERHQMVKKGSNETNQVECWFNTLRQRLARFTRKTLAFSKRLDRHQGLLHLFIYDYNLDCIS